MGKVGDSLRHRLVIRHPLLWTSAPQAFLGTITRAHEGGLNTDGGQVGGKRIAIKCLKMLIALPEVRRELWQSSVIIWYRAE